MENIRDWQGGGGSGCSCDYTRTWGILVVTEMFCTLTVSMTIPWFWNLQACTVVSPAVIIGGNWVTSTWSFCSVSYNAMWLYNQLKIKNLIEKIHRAKKKKMPSTKNVQGQGEKKWCILAFLIAICLKKRNFYFKG